MTKQANNRAVSLKRKTTANNKVATAFKPRRKALARAISASRVVRGGLKTSLFGGLFAGQLLSPAFAGPEGGNVVGGSADINQSDKNTTINQHSDRVSINWSSFNVAVDERVEFIQPDSSSVALNTILDQNVSTIRGSLDANGQVILVNPNGVLFTDTATISVNGLVASGLGIDSDAFMNGNMLFKGVEGKDGVVINQGLINASSVALVGKHVSNSETALISADVISLAAADEAMLTFDADGLIGVKIEKSVLENSLGVDSAVLNEGQLEGQKVLLDASVSKDLFHNAVNNSGTVTARGIDTSGGKIRLFGGSPTTEAEGSARVVNSGTLDASALHDGGIVHIEGDQVVNSGTILVDSTGSGNQAGKGGQINVLGDTVELSGESYLSAQGEAGGGEILIGGDYQGKNTEVRNATTTTIGEHVVIDASGNNLGDGGKVIVWANEDAYFYGFIDASSGLLGGDGGFIETSGKQIIDLKGYAVAKSHKGGQAGIWLIDPKDFRIVDSQDDTDGTNTVTDEFVEQVLNQGTSLTIQTTASNINSTNDLSDFYNPWNDSTNVSTLISGANTTTANGWSGKLIVDAEINTNVGSTASGSSGKGPATLTLIADGGDLVVNQAIINDGGGNATEGLNVVLQSDNLIDVNANITTAGGYVEMGGIAADSHSAQVDIAGGVTINTTDTITNDVAATNGSGDITIRTGQLTNSGTLNLGDSGASSTGGDLYGSFNLSLDEDLESTLGLVTNAGGVAVTGSNSADVTINQFMALATGNSGISINTDGDVDIANGLNTNGGTLNIGNTTAAAEVNIGAIVVQTGGAAATIKTAGSFSNSGTLNVGTGTAAIEVGTAGAGSNNTLGNITAQTLTVAGHSTGSDNFNYTTDRAYTVDSTSNQVSYTDASVTNAVVMTGVDGITDTDGGSSVLADGGYTGSFDLIENSTQTGLDARASGITFSGVNTLTGAGSTEVRSSDQSVDWFVSGTNRQAAYGFDGTNVSSEISLASVSNSFFGGKSLNVGTLTANTFTADAEGSQNFTLQAASASGLDGINSIAIDTGNFVFSDIATLDANAGDVAIKASDALESDTSAIFDLNGSGSALANSAARFYRENSGDGNNELLITEVAAINNTRRLKLADGSDEVLTLSGFGAAQAFNGIDFSDISEIDTGTGSDSLTADLQGAGETESFILSTSGDDLALTVGGIQFIGLDAVSSNADTNNVTNASGIAIGLVADSGNGNVAKDNQISATYNTDSLVLEDVSSVSTTGDLTATDANQNFTVSESSLNTLATAGITFSGVDSVDGAGGSDTVTGDSDQQWDLVKDIDDNAVANAISAAGIDFSGISNAVQGAGLVADIGSIGRVAGTGDTFVLGDKATRSLTVNGISFTHIGEVTNATGGSTTLSDTGAADYVLSSLTSVDSINGIDFNGFVFSGTPWSAGDTLALADGHSISGHSTANAIDVNSAQLLGSSGADYLRLLDVTFGGNATHDGVGLGQTDTVYFANIGSVDLLGDTGVAGDTVIAEAHYDGEGGNADADAIWLLTGNENELSWQGLTIANVDNARVADGQTGSIKSNGSDAFVLADYDNGNGNNIVTARGITFNSVNAVAVSGTDTVGDSGSVFYELKDDSTTLANSITFNGNAQSWNWSAGDYLGLASGHSFDESDTFVANGATLRGSDLADTFTLDGTTVQYARGAASGGVNFTGVTQIEAEGESDTIKASTDQRWQLTANNGELQLLDSNDSSLILTASSIEFVEAGDSVTGDSGTVETLEISGNQSFSIAAMDFSGIDSVTLQADDLVTDTDTDAGEGTTELDTHYQITNATEVVSEGITISGATLANYAWAAGDTIGLTTGHGVSAFDAKSAEILGTTGSDLVTLVTSSSIDLRQSGDASDVRISNVGSVDLGGSDSDSVVGLADQSWLLTDNTGNFQAGVGGITLAGIEQASVASGTASITTSSGYVDAFVISGSNSVTANGIDFSLVSDITLDSTDTVADDGTGYNYELASSSAVNVGDIAFTSGDIDNFSWASGDTLALAASHSFTASSTDIDANGATLTGTASDDTFTIKGSEAVDYQRASAGEQVSFVNVSDVDAGDDTTGDSIRSDVGTPAWQLLAGAEVSSSDVTFSNAEIFGEVGDDASFTGKSSAADAVTSGGTNSITVDGLTFAGIDEVNLTQSEGDTFGSSLSNTHFDLFSASRTDVNSIQVKGLTTSQFTWGAGDTLGLADGHEYTASSTDIDANGATLTGTTSDDTFIIKGSEAVDYQRASAGEQVSFVNVSDVDAGDSTTGDSIRSDIGTPAWQLLAGAEVSSSDVTFTNAEFFGESDDGASFTGKSGATDVVTSSAINRLTVDTLEFYGITEANLVEAEGDTFESIADSTHYSLVSSAEAFVNDIEVLGLSSSNFNWNHKDSIGLADGHTFTAIDEIKAKDATLIGSTGDDVFTITGSGELNYTRGDTGNGVSGVAVTITGLSEVSGLSGDDTVIGMANQAWSLISDDVATVGLDDGQNSIEASAQSLSFSDVDMLSVASGTASLANRSETDSYSITGDSSLDVLGLSISGLGSVVLDSSDTVTDDGVTGYSYELVSNTAVNVGSLAFTSGARSNFTWGAGDTVTLSSGHSVSGSVALTGAGLQGSDSADALIITGSDSLNLNYEGDGNLVAFTGVSTVDLDGGADTVSVSGSAGISKTWTLVSDIRVDVADMQISNALSYSGVVDDNTWTFNDRDSEVDIITSSGINSLTVEGIDFDGIQVAQLSSDDGFSSTLSNTHYDLHSASRIDVNAIQVQGLDTSGFTWDSNDSLGLADGHSFTALSDDIDANGATLRGSDLADTFTLSGTTVQYARGAASGGVHFTGVTTIDAGDEADTIQASSDQRWQLTANNDELQLLDSNDSSLILTASSIEFVEAGDSVTGDSGTVETLEISGNQSFSIAAMDFSGIDSVTLQADDLVTDTDTDAGEGTTELDTHYQITNATEVVSEGITISGATLANYAWAAGDTIGLTTGHGVSAFDAKSAEILGTTGSDLVTLVTSSSIDLRQSGDASDVRISNVGSVDLGGSDSDSVVGLADQSWLLTDNTGNFQAGVGGITLAGIEQASVASGTASITTSSGDVDAFVISGSNSVTANGIDFSSVSDITLDSTDTVADDGTGYNYELASSSAVNVGDLAFTNGDVDNFGWATGDTLALASSHSLTASSADIDANGATLRGSDLADTFTLDGTTVNYTRGAAGAAVSFTSVSVIDAGDEADTIQASSDQRWQLTANNGELQLLDSNDSSLILTASSIEFVEAGDSVTGHSGTAETLEISGNQSFSIAAMDFSGIDSVALQADDLVTDTDTDAGEGTTELDTHYQITNATEVVSEGITISGATLVNYAWAAGDTIGLTTGHGVSAFDAKSTEILGTTGSDLVTLVTSSSIDLRQSGDASDVRISNVGSVDLGDSDSDSVVGLADQSWLLTDNTGNFQAGVGGITLAGIEQASVASGTASITTSSGDVDAFVIFGSNSVTANGIDFTTVSAVTLDSTDTVVDDGVGYNYELVSSSAVNVGNIAFTSGDIDNFSWAAGDTLALASGHSFTASSDDIDANGATLTGTTSDDTFTITDTNDIDYQRASAGEQISFVNVSDVDAGDSTTGDSIRSDVGTPAWQLLAGAEVSSSGVVFSNAEIFGEVGDGASFTGKSGAIDAVTSTALNRVTVDTLVFAGIDEVNLTQSEGDTFGSILSSTHFDLYSASRTDVNSIQVLGLNTSQFTWALGDTLALASGHSFTASSDDIDANGATLTGTTSDDTFTIKGSEAVDYQRASTGEHISFVNVSDVDAGDSTTGDSIRSDVGTPAWQLLAGAEVSSSGVTFSNAEFFGEVGDGASFTGKSGAIDAVTSAALNSVTVDTLVFAGIDEVNLTQSEGDTFGSSLSNTHFDLFSASRTDVNSIQVKGLTTSQFTWGAGDTLGLADGHEYTASSTDIDANGATLTGTTSDDTFTIKGSEAVDYQRASAGEQVSFVNVSDVDAGDSTTGDSIRSDIGTPEWQLLAGAEVSSSDVTFTNAELFGEIGDGASFIGKAGAVDTVTSSAINRLTVDTLEFYGITEANLVEAEGDTFESTAASTHYSLVSSSEAHVNDINVKGLSSGAFEWDADDTIGLADLHTFIASDEIQAKDATLIGSTGDDVFTITGSGELDYTRGDTGNGVSGVAVTITGLSDVSGLSGDDTVIGMANQAWSLVSGDGQNSIEASAQSLSFSNVDVLGVASGTASLANRSETDSYSITGDSSLDVLGLSISGLGSVVLDGSDTVTDDGVTGYSYELVSNTAVNVGSLAFTSGARDNFGWGLGDQISLASAHSVSGSVDANSAQLLGSDSNDGFNLLAVGELEYQRASVGDWVQFSNLVSVDAGDAAGDSLSTDVAATEWALISATQVDAAGISFYNVDNFSDSANSATFVGRTSSADIVTTSADNELSVEALSFSGVASVELQDGDSFTVDGDQLFTLNGMSDVDVNEMNVTGLLLGQFDWGTGDSLALANGHTLTSSDEIDANSALLLGSDGDDIFSVLADNSVSFERSNSDEAVEFINVSTVDAGDASDVDTVINNHDKSWTLVSSTQVDTPTISFLDAESFSTGSNDATFIGSSSTDELVSSSNNHVEVLGLTFNGINKAELSADDTFEVDSASSVTYLIYSDSRTDANSIWVEGLPSAGFGWAAGDQIALADGHTYTQTIDAGGATLLGSDGEDVFTVTTDGNVSYQRAGSALEVLVTFDGAGTVDASLGDDLVVAASDQDVTINGENSVSSANLVFADIQDVTLTGGQLVNDASAVDEFIITGDSELSARGMNFSGVDSVLMAADDTSSHDGLLPVNYFLMSDKRVDLTTQNISLELDATASAFAWANLGWVVGDTVGLQQGHSLSSNNQASAIELNGATLVDGVGNDEFVIVDDRVVTLSLDDGSDNATIYFTESTLAQLNIESEFGSDTDTISSLSDWQIESTTSAQSANVLVDGIERITSASTVTGKDGNSDSVLVTSNDSFELENGIEFTDVDALVLQAEDTVSDNGAYDYFIAGQSNVDLVLSGGSRTDGINITGLDITAFAQADVGWSSDDVIKVDSAPAVVTASALDSKGALIVGSAAEDNTYTLISDDSLGLNGVNFSGVDFSSAAGWDNNDFIELADSFVLNDQQIDANYATFVSGDGDDTFNLEGLASLDSVEYFGGDSKLTLTNINNVLMDSGNDTVTGSSDQAWSLEGANQVSSNGVLFSGVDIVELADGQSVSGMILSHNSGNAETFNIVAENTVEVDAITFTGIGSVNLDDAQDSVTDAGDLTYKIASVNEIEVASINFSGAGTDDFSWGAGDQLTLAEGYSFTDGFSLDAQQASLLGSDGDDIFAVSGSSVAFSHSGLTAVEFTNVGSVDAAGQASSDLVTGVNGQTWQIDGNSSVTAVNASNSSASIAVTGVESVGAAGTDSHILGTSSADTFDVTGQNAVSAYQMDFNGVQSIAGNGGDDTVVGLDGADWQLLANEVNSVITSGVTFTEFTSATASGSTLHGVDNVADTFVLNSSDNSIRNNSDGILFSGVTRIDAGSGEDSVISSNAITWSLSGVDNQLIANGMDFVGIDRAVQEGSSEAVIAGSSGGTNYQLNGSDGALSAASIEFVGISQVEAHENDALVGSDLGEDYVLNSDASVDVRAISFTNIRTINAGSGQDSVAGSAADSWSAASENNELLSQQALALISGVSLRFTGLEQVTGTGLLTGSGVSSEYSLTDFNTIDIIGSNITFHDVAEVDVNGSNDTLIGPNLSASWTINGDTGSIENIAGSETLSFSGVEAIGAGSEADVFYFLSGSIDSVSTGAGNDLAYFDGGVVTSLNLGDGNDIVEINTIDSAPSNLNAGAGTDSLINNVAGLVWRVTGNISAVNYLGDFAFSNFESLDNNVTDLVLETSLQTVFNSSSVSFTDAGMDLSFNSEGNVSINSTNTSSEAITGRIEAVELDIVSSGDVTLETAIDVVNVATNDERSISVDILEDDDLVLRTIDAGRDGYIKLGSVGAGNLTSEGYGDTNFIAGTVEIGTDYRFLEIGDTARQQGVTFDVTDRVDMKSFFFVTPTFVGQVPTSFSAEGEEIQPYTGNVLPILESYAQVDPGIFESVNPYTADANALGGVEQGEAAAIVGGDAADAGYDANNYAEVLLTLAPTAAGEGDTEEEVAEELVTEDSDWYTNAEGQVRVALDEAGDILGVVVDYAVVQGDTMWDLSEQYLQNAKDWQAIWQRSPGVEDPDLIYPGEAVNVVVKVGGELLEQLRAALAARREDGSDNPLGMDVLVPVSNRNEF
ncbi:filamentous hemagglutinin N-terminal domain-containing protein [Agaribacterium sp. ZY112]|uniref:filamentous hemagglutinin N-terminal domain-containing protein n=1 Tax=Agaribacterium sp. ZY112 TaxID=3233574 RepID=UPI0035263B0F